MNYWWDSWGKMSPTLQFELMQGAVWELCSNDIIAVTPNPERLTLEYDCANFDAVRSIYQALKSYPADVSVHQRSVKKGHMPFKVVLKLAPYRVYKSMLKSLCDLSEKHPEIMSKVVMLTPREYSQRECAIYLEDDGGVAGRYDGYNVCTILTQYGMNGMPLPLTMTTRYSYRMPDVSHIIGVKKIDDLNVLHFALGTKVTKLQFYVEMARKSKEDVATQVAAIICSPPEEAEVNKMRNALRANSLKRAKTNDKDDGCFWM